MKINVIACCKNEERILPFFLNHYSSFCDTLMLCDGHSTDRSIDIIKSYPKATVIHLDDGNELHEGNLMQIRNHYYKQFANQYDWQIVVDVDEFLYAENLIEILEQYKRDGVTVPKVEGYQMGSLQFPDLGIPLVKQVTNGVPDPQWLNKNIIFNSNVDIRYTEGCHKCFPMGNVKYSESAKLKLLHYRYLSYNHFMTKSLWENQRRSQYNIDNGFGDHYSELIKMTEKEYIKMIGDMKPVI